MLEMDKIVEVAKVFVMCALWYSVSSMDNVIEKQLYQTFPYPMSVTLAQLLSLITFIPPLLRLFRVPRMNTSTLTSRYYFTTMVPLAVGKFVTTLLAHVSILKVPVSYAHTVKASLPLFTVLLTRILFKETQSKPVYLSIIPIISGVTLATVTELSFNLVGLLSALTATAGFSLMNIYTKKCMKDTGIHHLRLLLFLSRISTLLFFPLWCLHDFGKIYADPDLHKHWVHSLTFLLANGLLSCCHHILAFSILALLSPLSYAVANATKRIAIISLSLVLLRNPVTWANVLGMSVAIGGVMLYNKAKFDQLREKHRQEILPLIKSAANLSSLYHRPGPAGDSTSAAVALDGHVANHVNPLLKHSATTVNLDAYSPDRLMTHYRLEKQYSGEGERYTPVVVTFAEGESWHPV